MSLALLHPDAYPEGIRLELTQLVASLQAMLGREHDGDGRQRVIWQRWLLGEAQSIATATTTTIVFRVPDVRNVGDATVDPVGGSVTIRTPGVYLVSAQVLWGTSGTGVRVVRLLRDQTEEALSRVGALTTDPTSQWISAPLPCVAGTTISVTGYQDSGGALNVVHATATPPTSFLTIVRVA